MYTNTTRLAPTCIFLLLCISVFNILHAQSHAQKADSIKVKVYFALAKYNISTESAQTLDNFIAHHKEITWINIEAFTDSRASVGYNDTLAANRAKSVQHYLVTNGLSHLTETHINAFGKRKLLDMGTTEAAHQNNRVVILTCYVLSPFKMDSIAAAKKPKAITAPPVVTSAPAQTLPPAPPVDTVKPIVIEIKETLPTGEVEHGLAERIIQAIKHARIGDAFVLHTIYFEEGKHVFVNKANTALDAVLEVLKTRPTLTLEIQGHVCCTDSLASDALDFDTHLFNLSYARAQAISDYLVKKGIARERVESLTGFGSRRRIVYPEQSDADRNLNRRVEFKILQK